MKTFKRLFLGILAVFLFVGNGSGFLSAQQISVPATAFCPGESVTICFTLPSGVTSNPNSNEILHILSPSSIQQDIPFSPALCSSIPSCTCSFTTSPSEEVFEYTYIIPNNVTVGASPGPINVEMEISTDFGSGTTTSQASVQVHNENHFFDYEDEYCYDVGTISPTTRIVNGGSFQESIISGTGGWVINGLSGSFPPSAANIGSVYEITYATTNCGSHSDTVKIVGEVDPTFNYGPSYFCGSDPLSPPPTGPNSTLGFYWPEDTNLVKMDSTSGEIFLSRSVPGTYEIYHQIESFCTSKDTTYITIWRPDASFSYPGTPICPTDGDLFPDIPPGATSGGTFSALTSGINVLPSTGMLDFSSFPSAGSYDIRRIVDDSGCLDTMDISITVDAVQITPLSFTDTIFCEDNTLTVGPTSPPSGAFASSGLIGLNPSTGEFSPNASPPGFYLLEFNATGCSLTDTTEIEIRARDDASFAYDTTRMCRLAGIALPTITGTPGGSFSSPNLTVDMGTGEIDLDSGPFGLQNVKYTTSDPVCPAKDSIDILVMDTVENAFDYLGATTFCTGDTFVANTGLLTHGSFLEPTGGLDIDVNGAIYSQSSTPGVYHVILNSDSACSISDTLLIELYRQESALFDYPSSQYCVSQLEASPVIMGDGGGTFSIVSTLPPNVSIDNSTGVVDFAGVTNSVSNLVVEYETSGNCPVTHRDSFNITFFPSAAFSLPTNISNANGRICSSLPPFTVSFVSGSPSDTLYPVAISGNHLELRGDTIFPALSDTGTYVIYSEVGGSGNPCSNSYFQNIRIIDSISVSFSYQDSFYCSSDQVALVNVTPGGQLVSPLYTYVANNPGDSLQFSSSTNDSSNSGIVAIQQSDPGTYTVFLRDSLSACPIDLSTQLIIQPQADAYFSYTGTNFCSRAGLEFISVENQSGGRYWGAQGISILDSISGTIVLDQTTRGNYWVFHEVPGDCPDKDSVFITINEAPIPEIQSQSGDTNICDGDILSLIGAPYASNLTYSFWYGDTIRTAQTCAFGNLPLGQVEVFLSISDQTCTDTSSQVFINRPLPALNANTPRPTVKNLEELLLNLYADEGTILEISATGDSSTFWRDQALVNQQTLDTTVVVSSRGWESPSLGRWETTSLLEPGVVEVIIRSFNVNCEGETDTVYFEILNQDIFIPQLITPNGDGQNDTWEVKITEPGLVNNFVIEVYNREGAKVRHITSLNELSLVDDLPDGVYTYVIRDNSGELRDSGGLRIKRNHF